MAGAVQHPVPERLLVHIGDISVSFALLESSIQMLIGSLIAARLLDQADRIR